MGNKPFWAVMRWGSKYSYIYLVHSTKYTYTYMVVRALFCCILGPKSKGRAVGTWPGPPGSLGIWCHKGPIKLTLSRKVVVGVSWKSDQFVIDWAVLYLQKPKKIVGVFLNFQNRKFQKCFFGKKQMIWPIVSNCYLLYICVLLLWMEEERERESKLHWLWKTLPLGKQLLDHTRYIPF